MSLEFHRYNNPLHTPRLRTFRRNIMLTSSVSKYLLHGSRFDLEDEGNKFSRHQSVHIARDRILHRQHLTRFGLVGLQQSLTRTLLFCPVRSCCPLVVNPSLHEEESVNRSQMEVKQL
jgi:hypothetical protein